MKIFWAGEALWMTSIVFWMEKKRVWTPVGAAIFMRVLAHGVGGHLVIGDEDEVGAQGGVPLGGNLTVNQTVVDTGKKNVRLCHCDPFLSYSLIGLLHWVRAFRLAVPFPLMPCRE